MTTVSRYGVFSTYHTWLVDSRIIPILLRRLAVNDTYYVNRAAMIDALHQTAIAELVPHEMTTADLEKVHWHDICTVNAEMLWEDDLTP